MQKHSFCTPSTSHPQIRYNQHPGIDKTQRIGLNLAFMDPVDIMDTMDCKPIWR